MTTQAYHAASRELLAQGLDELERGDVRQASEKGWGAAAQMIKAISEARGWRHSRHRDLFVAVDRLVDETGDSGIYTMFQAAGNLHVNFYENWLADKHVRIGLSDVERLLDKLEPLVDG